MALARERRSSTTGSSREAAGDLFAMVRYNEERYFLSSTRYSTNAFFRRQLGREFTARDLYANFDETGATSARPQ